ncbi:MAG: hypothetical protein NWF11_01975 [Candidatus Bathyarchaeota archaeon]|nr:hypothetical protein [Candidatus Bathyarchaeota archaeon]
MREETELFKLLDENKIREAAEKLKGSSKEELKDLLLEARMANRVVQGKIRFLWDKMDSDLNLHK